MVHITTETPEQVKLIEEALKNAPALNLLVLEAMEAAGLEIAHRCSKPYYCGNMFIMFAWWHYINGNGQPRVVRWKVHAAALGYADEYKIREIAAYGAPKVVYTLLHGGDPEPTPEPKPEPQPKPPVVELKAEPVPVQQKLF